MQGLITCAGRLGDFVQGSASGGAQSLHKALNNIGNVGDAAAAVSQLRDAAKISGGVPVYSVNGRLDSAKLDETLKKRAR